MKKHGIQLKITLWFSALMLVMVALTYLVVFSVSRSIMQQNLRTDLAVLVEENAGDVRFYDSPEDVTSIRNADLTIAYGGGILVIDDDYLDEVNGMATALYRQDGTLLYGENPAAPECPDFSHGQVQTCRAGGVDYYLYDRQLSGEGMEGLWLRGMVPQLRGDEQLTAAVRLSLALLPLLLILAVAGGWCIAGRGLRPIRRLSDAASRISRGYDLKKRVDPGPGQGELHGLTETFNAMLDRLEESFAAERQFTSDASHELRTPMSVIMAQCEYTLEEPRSAAEYREALEVVHRQGRRMTALIRDMLDFTRLERRAGEEHFVTVNLSKLAERICQDMALLREKNITMTWLLQPEVLIAGNPELLSRLLGNLISNAYRYGRENGHISVTVSRRENTAVLSVADDGIGIPQDAQEKIFRRFYQMDASRTGGGTGLGLSMVQEIARLHGAVVRVESEPGQGSTFTCTFPEKTEALS